MSLTISKFSLKAASELLAPVKKLDKLHCECLEDSKPTWTQTVSTPNVMPLFGKFVYKTKLFIEHQMVVVYR